MSTTIDNRVVQMEFDNARFERNIHTTMSSLDNLKRKLNLDGATKGLESIDYASKKIDMSTLSGAVEKIQSRFSALEVVAITALANISNSAINAAKNIASSFTIDPIKTGFSEYETQINAIQTILANTESKGSTLQDVNNALAELNTYADKTIYNFTEMTRNIGTFTAAGVDLDTSVSAIKGIANLAAVSGSTSQQASTAMYQLSQALASGTVKLMDWNSVVNAGMGGQVFQDALKETARVHGVAIDRMIKDEGSFRETLKDGWLTSEILTETLSKFTGDLSEKQLKSMGYTDEQIKGIIKMGKTANDAATKVKTFTQLFDTLKEAAQSGWTKTWELIVGDFGEAKELLTEVSDTIGGMLGESADNRNNLLLGGLGTGWKQLLAQGIDDAAGFEETVKSVAKEHGVDVEKMIDDETTFQDTLKEGWLDSKILTESISKFTKKLSGLSEEEMEAQGYTEEHIKALKKLNKQVKDGSISMKEFSILMSRPSGRENLIDALRNSFQAIMSVIKPIKEAFREIFPATTADQLYTLTNTIKAFSEKLKGVEKYADKIKRTFKGLFAVIDIGVQFFKAIWDSISELSGGVGDLAKSVLDATATFGDWLVDLNNLVRTSGIFSNGLKSIVNFIKTGFGSAIKFVSGMAAGLGKIFDFFSENLDFSGFKSFHSFLEKIYETASGIKSTTGGIGKSIKDTIIGLDWSPLVNTLQYIIDAVKSLWNGIVDVLKGVNYNAVIDIVNAGLLTGILKSVKGFVDTFGKTVKTIGDSVKGVTDVLEAVKDTFVAYQQELKAQTLLKIATAIAMLAGSVLVLSIIDSKKLSASLGALTGLFANLMGSIVIFTKLPIFGKNKRLAMDMLAIIPVMTGMATAVLILATALKKVAGVEIPKMYAAVGAITLLSGLLLGLTYALSKMDGEVMKGALRMVVFALALKVLASVCVDLAALDFWSMINGLSGVLVLIYGMFAFLKGIEDVNVDGKNLIKAAVSLLIISGAIKVLASALADFAEISFDEMGAGFAALGGTLVILDKLTPKNTIDEAVSLTILSGALIILAHALKQMSSISFDEMGTGFAALGGALVILDKVMPTNTTDEAFSLTIIAGALIILSEALKRMSSIGIYEICNGLSVLAGSLTILCVALESMKDCMSGSTALLVAVGALTLLAPVLAFLGAMSIGAIAKGIVAIAASFAVLGVAGTLLEPLAPTILTLCGSLALLGLGTIAVGVGLMAIGAGLTSIAAGITALIAVIPGALIIVVGGIKEIILSIVDLIPQIFKRLGTIITTFCQALIDALPAIGEALGAIIGVLLDVLTKYIPQLVDMLFKFVVQILEKLIEYIPPIVTLIIDFVIKLFDAISAKLPALIQAGVKLFMSFFQGIVDGLKGVDPGILIKGILGIGFLSAMMVALSAVASLVPGAMVGVLGIGLVIAELALVLAAVGALAQIPGLEWLISEGGGLLQTIGVAIGQFVGGIAGGIASGVTSQFPQIGTDLANFMINAQPFFDGLKAVDPALLESVKALGDMILTITGANILDSLTSWVTGGNSLATFGAELAAFGPYMAQYAQSVAGIDATSVEASANAAKALSEMAANLPKEGGVVGWFTGETDFSTFGTQLVAFGTALKSYSAVVNGLNTEAIDLSVTAGKSLSELASSIPNLGGMVTWFTGDNDLTTFGTELLSFGSSLKEYSITVVGINVEAIMASVEAARALADMAAVIPNMGGVVSWFTGKNDLETFGKKLKDFGKHLKKYSSEVAKIDVSALSSTTTQFKALVDMAKSASGVDFEGINSFGKSLKKLGKTGVDDFIKAFTDSAEAVKKAAQDLLTTFIKGAEEKTKALKTSFGKLADAAKNAASTKAKYELFYKAGAYLVAGFAAGIKANTFEAEAKAKAMAAAAANAAKKELDEHSPSKVGYKIGDFFGIAFVNAIGDNIKDAYNTSAEMAASARSGLTDAIRKVQNYIDLGVETEPTIRPVIDLSGVTEGVNSINGLLDLTPSVGVMSNIRAISANMDRNQNGFNDDVLKALKDLKDAFGNSSGDTYTFGNFTYDDGSNISDAVQTLVRAAKMERRV